MANIFLDANDSFTQSSTNTNDSIFGRSSGTENVILQGNPTGTTLDGNIEVVQVAGTAATTTLQVNATTGRLELVSGGTVFATFSGGLNQAVSLRFTDGDVTLSQTGANAFTIANPTNAANNVTINPTTPQAGGAVTLGSTTSTAGTTTGGGTATSTFTLTTGVDDIQGSASDDTINALQTGDTSETFGAADAVNGNAGTDTLILTNTEAAVANAAIVSNVENIVYRSTAAGADLDMVNFTGETSLTLDRTAATADVTNLTLSTSLNLNGLRSGADSTITYLASDVTGASDAGSVTVNGVLDGAEVDFSGAIESFTITSSGDASRFDNLVLPGTVTALTVNAAAGFRVDDVFTASALTTLSVTGAGAVTITPALATTATTIAAGAATGAINLTMGAANQTITTGSGDDVIDMQGNLNASDTINLGAGTDTLRIDTDGLAAGVTDLNLTGVEVFRFDNTVNNNGAINMDTLSPTQVRFDGVNGSTQVATTGVVTLTDLATTVTSIDLIGAGSDGAPSDNVAFNGVTVDYDVSGTTNVAGITFNINNAGTAGDDFFVQKLTIDNTESVTINAADIGDAAADELTITEIEGNDFTSVAIVSNQEVIVNDIDGDSLTSVNLSGVAAGGAAVTISDHAAELSVTGSLGNDIITLADDTATHRTTVNAGAGNDIIVSVDGTDTITGGAGVDTFVFQGDLNDDANVITDFVAGSGGDIIDFVTSAVANTTNVSATASFAAGATGAELVNGFTTIGTNAGALDATTVKAFMGTTGSHGGTAFSLDANNAVQYFAVDNGTNTGIYLASAATDATFANATVTLLVTLTGVSDATTLNASNLADFL